MKFFAFFFVALAAILALVGAYELRGGPVDRARRSAAPGKYGGYGGGGYGGGGYGGYGHGGHKG